MEKIENIKILELFCGYGTSSFALKQIGINADVVGYSDIDKYANQCFKQNHCKDDKDDIKRLWDVKLIVPRELPDFDLLTGGFPCQSFSNAGKQLGELDPRGTLFYEIIRIAEFKKPKYMLLENVKGLTCDKFEATFKKILSEINRIGYNCYWDILDTKDYGVPQSRERVFFVCIRKDIDDMTFEFPDKEELKLFIKDVLETYPDKKYNLSQKMINGIINSKFKERQPQDVNDVCSTLKVGGDVPCFVLPKDNLVYCGNNPVLYNPYNDSISEKESITLGCSCGSVTGSSGQIVMEKNKDNVLILPGLQDHKQIREDGIVNCLTSAMRVGGGHVPMVSSTLTTELAHSTGRDFVRSGQAERIYNSCGMWRRLTPKECFRLQGFLNDEVDLSGLSDTRAYKLAGNGQSVNVVARIYKQLFFGNQNKNINIRLNKFGL